MALRKKKIKLKKVPKHFPHGEGSRKLLDVEEEQIVNHRKRKEDYHVPPRSVWTDQNREMGTPYGRFLLKWDDFDNMVDKFTTQDLCFYFRDIAGKRGVKYYLVFSRDCAVMKRLRETYSAREICGMIDFVFNSGQDYLDIRRVSITTLGSRWINTIYPDFELWVKGEYRPRSEKKSKGSVHEWKMLDDGDVSTVGVW